MTRMQFSDETHAGFYAAIKRRVDEYFQQTGRTRFANAIVFAKGTVYALIVAASYAGAVSGSLGGAGSLALAGLCGIAALLLAINVAHDAAHNCLTPSRTANRIITTACFTLLGTSGYLWQQRHVRSHHVFPNVNGCDIDIDENPLLRLSPNHTRRPMHRWQHLYAPLAYVLVTLHTVFIQDFVYLLKTELANMRNIRRKRREYAMILPLRVFARASARRSRSGRAMALIS
jgi:linoleoyl-CoA desaturase